VSPYNVIAQIIKKHIACMQIATEEKSRVIEIPVCYRSEFAPDLDLVAKHNSLTVDEVISIHVAGEYLVYMLGFMPGFPYLGNMSEKIATPRLPVPRREVPAGSVGIGGLQTGIYPYQSPGGWNIIGRTPLRLFDLQRQPPNLLQIRDKVRFNSITVEEFDAYSKDGAKID
ncbi:MAG: 5-oxoprolinase subunit PxpB, partial [Pyrinomonadaceae bacterium]